MAEPIIRTENLNVIYNLGKSNEYHALKNINIEIYPEEYIILFGPSGCGKSTLLYVILGALPPASGEIFVKGENPYSFSVQKRVEYQRFTVGIIYQAFYLIPSISVLDNVALPQIFSANPPEKRKERAMELLRRFGVESQADKIPVNLSGGQQQRVAVARSLVNDPDILLADEPVGNLDSISAAQVMNTLEEINQKDKKTVILITHDPSYLPYAHRIYYLRDGKIEREVINPEKPQIKPAAKGKQIFTEIEKLARMYPYLPPPELRIKSIMNYISQDLSLEQLEMLEKAVRLLVDGKILEKDFSEMLTRPLAEGGAEIHSHRAREITEKILDLLEKAQDIKKYRKTIEENVLDYSLQSKLVRKLRADLLDIYEGEIDIPRIRRLEEAIAERVAGSISKFEFQRRLDRSWQKGGVGFDWRTARKLTLYLEKLLAQGITQ